MSLATDIITTIRSSENGKSMELKQLRNSVLSLEVDKQSKKLFKSTIKELEKDDKICLSSGGIVKLSKSQRSTSGDKKSKKKKEKKKRKRESKGDDDDVDEDVEVKKKKQGSVDEDDIEDTKEEDQNDNNEDLDNTTNNEEDIDPADKNKPCKNNPQVSRYDVCTGSYFVM